VCEALKGRVKYRFIIICNNENVNLTNEVVYGADVDNDNYCI